MKCAAVLVLLGVCAIGRGAALSDAQLERVGRKIFLNEAGGKVAGLVDWNSGEAFASLGIGHFIWYPAGKPGPFEESFPEWVAFAVARGSQPPDWLAKQPKQPCPWPTRSAFLAERDGARAASLRSWLANSMSLQAAFCEARLRRALGLMERGLDGPSATRLRGRFAALSASERGLFAMIDYVNFKGEGVKESERYQGEGWGLRQVLLTMKDDSVESFGDAAADVLRRRVKNSPPARGESRWLPGWVNRVSRY